MLVQARVLVSFLCVSAIQIGWGATAATASALLESFYGLAKGRSRGSQHISSASSTVLVGSDMPCWHSRRVPSMKDHRDSVTADRARICGMLERRYLRPRHW